MWPGRTSSVLKDEGIHVDARIGAAIVRVENRLPDAGPVMKNEGHVIATHDLGVESIGRAPHTYAIIFQDVQHYKGDA